LWEERNEKAEEKVSLDARRMPDTRRRETLYPSRSDDPPVDDKVLVLDVPTPRPGRPSFWMNTNRERKRGMGDVR
jgi:hypothetical protein